MRHSRHVIAELPGIICEDDREPTIAGNQSDPLAIGDMRQ
jgi:hypothetical protein